MAFATKGKLDPSLVYFWKENYSSSYNFYTKTIRKPFVDSNYQQGDKVWLLYDIRNEEEIKEAGFELGKRFSTPDYEITKLDIKFINPKRRESQCTQMVIAEVIGRRN